MPFLRCHTKCYRSSISNLLTMKVLLFLLMPLLGSAQWVDKNKLRDSLQMVARRWNNMAGLYSDSADASSNQKDIIRYSLYCIAYCDSASHYIVWSEEENCEAIKELRLEEGLRISLLRIKMEPVDSTIYKMIDTLYLDQRARWIADLKKLNRQQNQRTTAPSTYPIYDTVPSSGGKLLYKKN